jgi:hypothetical protein
LISPCDLTSVTHNGNSTGSLKLKWFFKYNILVNKA